VAIVFVSYRHEDSGGYAGWIADRLQERFGEDNVFRDIDSLRGGLSFEEVLDQQLARATVVVAVIGKQWATITDDKGHRRLQAHDDWVRREVEEGLGRKIPVIPVLVGGAALPKRDDLPSSLQGLLKMQAVELRDGRSWATDLELLVRDIDSSRRWLRDKRLWVALLLLLLLTSAIGLYLHWPLSPPLTTNPSPTSWIGSTL
jgi:hypothetical protein